MPVPHRKFLLWENSHRLLRFDFFFLLLTWGNLAIDRLRHLIEWLLLCERMMFSGFVSMNLSFSRFYIAERLSQQRGLFMPSLLYKANSLPFLLFAEGLRWRTLSAFKSTTHTLPLTPHPTHLYAYFLAFFAPFDPTLAFRRYYRNSGSRRLLSLYQVQKICFSQKFYFFIFQLCYNSLVFSAVNGENPRS